MSATTISAVITAEEIISLAQSPTSALPAPLPVSSLLSLLNAPNLPSPTLISSLLTLLLRSPPPSSLPFALLTPLFPPIFHRLSSSSLPSLLEILIADLSSFSDPNICTLLDLLPSLLTLIITSYGTGTISPFLDQILTSDWSKPFLLKFSSILREFPPSISNNIPPFLEKIFDGMNGVDIQDLPSVVYQLLLLASKGVCRRDLIKGILVFFGGQIKGPASIIRQIEGTVLMHVNFAVKQDLSLGQEIIAVVKSNFGALNHFMVNILLSIARVKRFNESIMNVIKLAIVDSNRDCKVSRHCKWLPECLKEQCLETAKSIEKAILKSVNESNGGREHVVQSIVQLGFLLLETLDGDSTGEDGQNDKLIGVEMLAIQMLRTLFEIHEMARTEIIEQCKNRILAMKPQQSNGSIRLLGCLVQNYRYTMLGFVSYLKELLDYFAYMHEKTASALIDCILPLVKSSRELQDYIILVVRKAMFKREESVRVAAMRAIVDLICIQNGSRKRNPNPLLDSSSQASSSQQAELLYSDSGKNLFHDLCGLLRRCLSQQARVKEVLYEGLVKIVESDPSIANSIFDFLWPHFLLFYSEDSACPIKMDACFKVENAKTCVIIEPLNHMISCLTKILIISHHHQQDQIKSSHPARPSSWASFDFSPSQDNENVKSSSSESFSKALSKIKKFLRKCSTEDKQILSQEAGCTEMNHMRRILFLSITEIFINTSLLELENSKNNNQEPIKSSIEKEITELIDSHQNFLEKKSGISKKTKSHFFATSALVTLLETSVQLCTSSTLSSAKHTQDRTQNRTQQSKKKDENNQNTKIISFSLFACLKHIQSIDSSKQDFSNLKKLVKPVIQLVFLLVPGTKQETGTSKKNVKSKSEQLLIALTCFKELCKITSLSKDHFGVFFKEIISVTSPETEIDNENQILELIWLFWEKDIKPIFSQLISSSLYAESEILAELISIIGAKFPCGRRKLLSLYLNEQIKTQKIENPNLSCTLFSLITTLIPAPNDLTFAKEITSELLSVIGSGSEDPIPESETLLSVNFHTKDALAGVLIEGTELSVVEFKWVLVKIKEVVVNGVSHGGKRFSRVDLEDAFYSRLVQVVHLLSIFADMNLNDSQAEQFLKLNAKFYKLLARVAKFQIAPKGHKQTFPGAKFQKLAEETCKLLTCQLYSFVALVQWKQDNTVISKGALSKIKRESRCIPDLIFQIEDYEKYLIKLTKLTKVNLMRYAKRSASRDFKIIVPRDEVRDVKEPEQEAKENENGVSSENDSEKCESLDEKSAAYTDSEREEGVLERRKRAKSNDVVQDSDDEF